MCGILVDKMPSPITVKLWMRCLSSHRCPVLAWPWAAADLKHQRGGVLCLVVTLYTVDHYKIRGMIYSEIEIQPGV